MKYILSLSLLSVVFALPAPQGGPDSADHAYDKFEFRVGHIKYVSETKPTTAIN